VFVHYLAGDVDSPYLHDYKTAACCNNTGLCWLHVGIL